MKTSSHAGSCIIGGVLILVGIAIVLLGTQAIILGLLLVAPYIAIRRRRLSLRSLSPTAAFVPLYIAYNGIGLLLYHGPHRGYIFVLFALGLAGFLVGDLVARRPRLTPRPRLLRPSILLLRANAGVGFVVMLLLARTHNIPALSADPNSARLTFFPSGYASTAAIVPLYVALTGSSIWLLSCPLKRSRRLELGLYVVMSILLLASTANRGQLAAPLLTVVIWAAVNRRWRLGRLLLLASISFIIISISGYLRYRIAFGPTYDRDLAAAGFSGIWRYFGTTLTYVQGTISTLAQTITYFPGRLAHPFGAEFFGPLLHRPSADRFLKSSFGLNFSGFGLALGTVNAFYLDWGAPGVLIGLGLVGALMRGVYNRAYVSRSGALVVYCYLVGHFALANYGHPFAYLSDLLYPLMLGASLTLGPIRGQRLYPQEPVLRHV